MLTFLANSIPDTINSWFLFLTQLSQRKGQQTTCPPGNVAIDGPVTQRKGAGGACCTPLLPEGGMEKEAGLDRERLDQL